MIGVRGHALVEIPWCQRIYDFNDRRTVEPEHFRADNGTGGDADPAGGNELLDRLERAVRRSLFHSV